MSDEKKRWPFDGFYLKLAEAQREYDQEQRIDPASLTEEERTGNRRGNSTACKTVHHRSCW